MSKLNLVSWNEHGIRLKTKKIKILDYVSKLKADILLLQETRDTFTRIRRKISYRSKLSSFHLVITADKEGSPLSSIREYRSL